MIKMLNKKGKLIDYATTPNPDDPRLLEGLHYDESDVLLFREMQAKRAIDTELAKQNIDPREQIVTTANGLQFALVGLSTLVIACSKSEDTVLKEASQPLLPFATSFLQARESGDMPIDVLGLESVAEKVITTSVKSGRIVKAVLTSG